MIDAFFILGSYNFFLFFITFLFFFSEDNDDFFNKLLYLIAMYFLFVNFEIVLNLKYFDMIIIM